MDTYSKLLTDFDAYALRVRVSLSKLRALERLQMLIPKAVYDEFKQSHSDLTTNLATIEKHVTDTYNAQ